MSRTEGVYGIVWRVVRSIPPGRVSTYGAVARMAGLPGRARLVGYAMHSVPSDGGVPWHRVVNSKGMISRHPDPMSGHMQRSLLEAEGVMFDGDGRIDLDRFGWTGGS